MADADYEVSVNIRSVGSLSGAAMQLAACKGTLHTTPDMQVTAEITHSAANALSDGTLYLLRRNAGEWTMVGKGYHQRGSCG